MTNSVEPIVVPADTSDLQKLYASLGRVQKQSDSTGRAIDKLGDDFVKATRGTKGFAKGVDDVERRQRFVRGGMQNMAFQIQDVATQLQMGTSGFVVFAQQVPQMLGGLGLIGAALGGVVAVAGAVIPLLLDMESATEKLDAASERLAKGGIESMTSGYETLYAVADRYVEAINATGPAQATASRIIIANSKAEFEARKSLLELRLKERQVALQAAQASLTEGLQAQRAREAELAKVNAQHEKYSGAHPVFRNVGSTNTTNRARELKTEIEEIGDGVKKLAAETTLAELEIKGLQETLKLSFSDMQAEVDRGTEKSGGGGRKKRVKELKDELAALLAEYDKMGTAIQKVFPQFALLEVALAQQEVTMGQYTRASEGMVDALSGAGAFDEATELAGAAIVRLNERLLEGTLSQDAYAENMQRIVDAMARVDEAASKAQEKSKLVFGSIEMDVDAIGKSFASGFQGAFEDFVSGTKTAEEAFRSFAASFLQQMAQMILQQAVLNAIKLAGFADGGAFDGSGVLANAKGNAFGGQGVDYFANGGVVRSPTMFRYGGDKLGVMGEAGAEAVMPLKRTRGGKLGVSAEGIGGNNDNGPVIRINNVLDDNAIAHGVSSAPGERAVMNVINRNRRELGLA